MGYNSSKSESMIIASTPCARAQALNLIIRNSIPKQVDSVNYLGILIDGTLSWTITMRITS